MPTLTLYPYLQGSTWVFDDPRTNLKEEAFVLGSSEVLTRLVEAKNIPDAGKGFTLHFATEPFDGFDTELRWLRSDDSQVVPGQDGSATQVYGNWYSGVVAGRDTEGWLCPALGLYFGAAPARIFVDVDSLPPGVDPVWQVTPDDLPPRRFVAAPG